jgi:hypothetical protein
MKKLFLAFTVVAFSAVSAQAQTTSFGLKGGMTGANEKASANGFNISSSTKIGFYAGAFAEIGVSENFAVQPELFYSSMGDKINVSFNGQTFKGTDNFGYINLPILAKYKNSGFSAFLGPQIGYLLSAKSKGSSDSTNNTTTVDVKNQMKSTDISGVIGVGYTLANGFGFDARYQLGLTDISKSTAEKVKNNAFLIGIHYQFNSSK